MKLELTFPFPPRREQVQGAWQPLYLEPMIGSGERLCVGMVAASPDAFCVVPVAGIERLDCLYGKEGLDFFQKILDETFLSLRSVLSSKEARCAFSDGVAWARVWQAPFEGLETGHPRLGAGNTIEEIARSGLMMCSSLTVKLVDVSSQSAEAMTRTRMESNVKNIVTGIKPNLEPYFRISRTLDIHARPVSFGFVGQNLAANFAHLAPSTLEATVSFAKSKMWDLRNLRVRYGSDSVYSERRNNYELFLWIPGQDDVTYSDKQHRDLNSAVRLLEVESSQNDVSIFAHNSVQDMATHLIQSEAA